MVGTLSVGTLTESHTILTVNKKKSDGKMD